MIEFREEIICKPPFWSPFLLALGLGALGSALMIWLRLAHNYNAGLLFIGIGVLCGWGTRIKNGDFSSLLVALAILQFSILLIVGSIEIAREMETSVLAVFVAAAQQGKITELLNECLSHLFVESLSVKPLIFAYLAGYGITRIGKD